MDPKSIKGEKIPRKMVDALVSMAVASALDRLAEDEQDAEAAETLRDGMDYLESRKRKKKGLQDEHTQN
jgi:hypothetical protein